MTIETNEFNIPDKAILLFTAMKQGLTIRKVTCMAGASCKDDRTMDFTIENFKATKYWGGMCSNYEGTQHYDYVDTNTGKGFYMSWVISFELATSKEIKWVDSPVRVMQNKISLVDIIGLVDNEVLFFIKQETIKIPRYQLQSYPFRNKVFTRANNSKKLKDSLSVDELKTHAQELLDEYVNFFLKPFVVIDIAKPSM